MKLQTPGCRVETSVYYLNRKQSNKSTPSIVKSMNFGVRLFGLKSRLYHWLSDLVVVQLCPTLCDLMDCSMPGFIFLYCILEFAQTHVHWIGDAIQQSHPLSSPSPPALNHSQYQCLFQWVKSSHQMTKVLELQLWEQSFQWIFRVDFL